MEPIRSISPTLFTMVKKCALRAMWVATRRPRLLPAPPTARVGTVAHQLLAEAGQGRLTPDKEVITERWNRLTEQAHSHMWASAIERHLVPLTRSVPDLAVRRIRAVQRAYEISRSRRPFQASTWRVKANRGYGYEIPVRSSDNLVRGRIDSVVPSAQGPVVQDYKSGSVLETAGVNAGQVRDDYTGQLKVYAALYAEEYGTWPISLKILHSSGEVLEIAYSKAECLELLAEARTALQKLNETIRAQPKSSLLSILATPEPSNCSYCEFRPACAPYQVARHQLADDQWPLDVIGKLAGISQLGNGKLMLSIVTDAGPINVPGLSSTERHPQLSELKKGDYIGAFALWRPRPTAPFSESSVTTIYRLPVDYEGRSKGPAITTPS